MRERTLPPIMDGTWDTFAGSITETFGGRPDGLHHERVRDERYGRIDCVWIVQHGTIVAVAYWYIDGTWECRRGGVNLMVCPLHRRMGYGKALWLYLLAKGMDPEQSDYTAAGKALRDACR